MLKKKNEEKLFHIKIPTTSTLLRVYEIGNENILPLENPVLLTSLCLFLWKAIEQHSI